MLKAQLACPKRHRWASYWPPTGLLLASYWPNKGVTYAPINHSPLQLDADVQEPLSKRQRIPGDLFINGAQITL